MTTAELDRMLDAAPIGVVIYSAEGKILRANRAFGDMIGFSHDELLERTWHEVTHPSDAKAQSRIMENVRKTGVPEDLVKRYITKACRNVWARATYGPAESGEYVVYVVPEPDAEPPQTLTQSLGRFLVANYKTGAMLVVTAFGSIWAQYNSFVGRIESAEQRAAQAEHDVDLLKPLLLQLRVRVNAEHQADAERDALPDLPPAPEPATK